MPIKTPRPYSFGLPCFVILLGLFYGSGAAQADNYFFEEGKLIRYKQSLEDKQQELPKLIAQLDNLLQRYDILQEQGEYLRSKLKTAKQLHLASGNSLELTGAASLNANKIKQERLKLTGMFVQARVKHAYYLKKRIRDLETLINRRFKEIEMLEINILEQEALVENLSKEDLRDIARAY